MCLCSLEIFAWPLCHEYWGVLLLLLVGALSFRVEPWPWYLTIQKCQVFGGLPLVAKCVSNGTMVKKIGKMFGSRKEILFLSNPKSRTCFLSACCIPIVNKITYCEAAWKNSSRWTNKTWSESFSNEHRIPDCFNKQVQNIRCLANMLVVDRWSTWCHDIVRLPHGIPTRKHQQWLDDERNCWKKCTLQIV